MDDGRVEAGLNAKAEYFELAQDRVGGERWEDEPLRIRLRAEYDPGAKRLKVGQFSLASDQVDIGIDGAVTLAGALPGEAHVKVERLPRGALALLQDELTERLDLVVDTMEGSATLELEATAAGEFARPEAMDSRVSLRMAGWSLATPQLPGPLLIRNLNVLASRDEVELRALNVELAGVVFSARGTVPVCAEAVDRAGELLVTADGNTETIFDFLSRMDLAPRGLNYLRIPLHLEATGKGAIVCNEVTSPGAMRVRLDDFNASATWKPGEIGARDLAEPIHLEAGRAVYTGQELTLERLSLSTQRVSLRADGTIGGLPLPTQGAAAPSFNGKVVSSGEITDLVALLSPHVRLPAMPRDLTGQYQLSLSGSGEKADLKQANYEVRLLLDKVGALVETPYRQVRVGDLGLELRLDRDLLDIRRGSLRILDEEFGNTTVEFKVSADRSQIRADVDARTNLEYLPALLPKDLKDIYMKGPLPVAGWARLTPREALPTSQGLTEAWIEFFKRPGLTVDVKGSPDLLADFEFANKQEAPVEIFPRDFPIRIANIRGSARLTPKGIILREVRADFGTAKDVLTSGTIHLGRPTVIDFEAQVDRLDINEWTEGWGQREWASYSASFEPRWKSIPDPYLMALITGKIRTKSARIMRYDGEKLEGSLRFESWSRIPNKLWVSDLKGTVYGGDAAGNLEFDLPDGDRPILRCKASFRRADLRTFMNALYERDQKMDGYITGDLNFDGQLLNYPTYKGDARYTIERSSLVGNIILDYARDVFEMTSSTGLRDSQVHGSVSMYDQKVFFPDLVILNPNINLTADGYVDFRGRLFFDVTASIIAKRLKEIPFVRIIGEVVDMVGNQIVSYEVRGNLSDPKYRPVFTPMGRLLAIREVLKESQKPVIRPEQEQKAP
jgi:hypothetical protein